MPSLRSFWILIVLIFTAFQAQATIPPGQLSAAADARIESILSRMTLEEKVRLLGGDTFHTEPFPRLGIPSLKMTDGPLGVRDGRMTAFPAGIALGASFDPDLIERVAAGIAEEARFDGRNMLLGPCVNISRQPFGGRNFESFGEDPYLTSEMAARYVRGAQSQNVIATVKHFAANDQEYQRMTINANVDTRTLFEIYLPPFERAVDAGAWSVMAAYNRINGSYASENDVLQNQILKTLWGFQGLIVSDWGATHSTVPAALHGLDLEMPSGEYFNGTLVQAVKSGEVPAAVIDDKVRRVLRAMSAIGLLGPTDEAPLAAPLGPDSVEHRLLAREAARESIVLLKNTHAALPLNSPLKRVAVIGPNAMIARTGGGGSSHVTPFEAPTPLDVLRKRLGAKTEILFATGRGFDNEIVSLDEAHTRTPEGKPGLKAEFFAAADLSGTPFLTRVDSKLNFNRDTENDPRMTENFSIRWTGRVLAAPGGTTEFTAGADDGIRVWVDGQKIIDRWGAHEYGVARARLPLKDGTWHDLKVEYMQLTGMAYAMLGADKPAEVMIRQAADLARKADAAIVFTGLGSEMESEGRDRGTMDLPDGQDDLIRAVAAANQRTIVVLTSANPLSIGDWFDDVPAILQTWYPGEEGAYAIADILQGRVNPSGKLPITWLSRWEDSPAYGHYPGQNGNVDYKEGIFVGYRHFDKKGIAPLFPFGYGLSYTRFAYSGLSVKLEDASSQHPRAHVQFQITNTGAVFGREIAELYVGELAPHEPRPVRELKGFRKLGLEPGASRRVELDLDARSFAHFDPEQMKWIADPGRYQIEVGGSSRDLPLKQAIELTP